MKGKMSAQGGFASGGKKISKKILFCIIFLSCFLLWGNALAADYYVRADATGSNNGSDWTNAYTALPATLDRGTNGSTYYIADGNYGGYVFDTTNVANDGTKVITIKKATVAAHGTGTGWSDTYGDGQAVFQQPDDFSNTNRIHVFRIGVSYITIDGAVGSGSDPATYGFKFLQHPSYGDAENVSPYQNGFSLIDVGGIGWRTRTITNVKLLHIATIGSGDISCVTGTPYECTSEGFNVYFATTQGGSFNDVEIGYVYAYGFKENVNVMGGSIASVHHGYFLDNVSDSVGGHGQNMNLNTVDEVDIYDNVFKDSETFCIAAHDTYPGQTNHARVYNNIFTGSEGMTRCIAAMTGMTDVIWSMSVYNNTFVDIDGMPLIVQNVTDVEANKSYVYNNLFYSCTNLGLTNGGGTPGAIVHDYNAYISSTGYTAATHNQVDTDGADPFVDLVNSDYSIDITADTANDAHVINTGLTLASPYDVDYIGTERPAGSGFDIGAYEYVGASDIVAPASPTGLSVT